MATMEYVLAVGVLFLLCLLLLGLAVLACPWLSCRGIKVTLSKKETMENVRAGDDHWQLLPGIPDEITKDKIGPKLPWKTFHALSRVNRGWQQAIRGQEFYNARVRSHSTQTLLVLHLDHEQSSNFDVIALYSVNDNSCYLLPPIPGTGPKFGIHLHCGQCIFLDGKLYVLGGFKYLSGSKHSSRSSSSVEAPGLGTRSEVYVMDLAGQRQWKQCASMQDPRNKFGCGVMNGKIYVFGGICKRWPVCGSEVYDTTADVWSPIAPMLSFRFDQRTTAVGQEFFVHGGTYIHSQVIYGSNKGWERNELVDLHVSLRGKGYPMEAPDFHPAYFAEVYHPLKDEWRIVENFTKDEDMLTTELLMVEGKLHRIQHLGIDLYHTHSNSWKSLQSLSVDILTPSDYRLVDRFMLNSTLVDDRIITRFYSKLMKTEDIRDSNKDFNDTLVRSDRLGGKNKEIVMRDLQIQSSLPPGYVIMSLFRGSIQL